MQAPLQMEMDVKNVPSEFRYDPKSVKYAQARAYADSFGTGQVRASNAQGCKRYVMTRHSFQSKFLSLLAFFLSQPLPPKKETKEKTLKYTL